jgi:DNA repair protein RadA/Sms
VAVIDSIQTLYSDALSSAPGSVAQVRECAAQLTRAAKQTGMTIILVGHVTKEGALAGPRVLEHIVDTVLYFEGDNHSSFRLVRAIKNRFGAVNELGVFAMTEKGLKGVSNPSALFLSQHDNQVPGSCVMVTQEGTRPLLVEIQALVDASHQPNARRLSVGLEQNRLAMLLAVLHRHAGIAAFDQDVFINAVGGVKITEPAADLAVLLAINSRCATSRCRAVSWCLAKWAWRARSGRRRGPGTFARGGQAGLLDCHDSDRQRPKQPIEGMTIISVDRIDDAFNKLREIQ